MKKITLLTLIVSLSLTSFAQTWSVDKAHAKIGFTVTHLMLSELDGNFTKFDATIKSSKLDFSDAIFELTIDPASINTNNDKRDEHLRNADFFDVETYPLITFKSTSIKQIEGKKYKAVGNLTMHGVTKPVTFELTLNGIGKNMRTQKPIAGFKAIGTINRTDFGVGKAPAAMLSEEVEIRANGEFVQE